MPRRTPHDGSSWGISSQVRGSGCGGDPFGDDLGAAGKRGALEGLSLDVGLQVVAKGVAGAGRASGHDQEVALLAGPAGAVAQLHRVEALVVDPLLGEPV